MKLVRRWSARKAKPARFIYLFIIYADLTSEEGPLVLGRQAFHVNLSVDRIMGLELTSKEQKIVF